MLINIDDLRFKDGNAKGLYDYNKILDYIYSDEIKNNLSLQTLVLKSIVNNIQQQISSLQSHKQNKINSAKIHTVKVQHFNYCNLLIDELNPIIRQNEIILEYEKRYLDNIVSRKILNLIENDTDKINEEYNKLKNEKRSLTIQHALANETILKLREKIRKGKEYTYYKSRPEELQKIVDENRFKTSGKPNYSAIGRIIGKNHETVKKWVKELHLYEI